MALFTRRRFVRTAQGDYTVRIRPEERALLASLPDQLEALVTSDKSAATTRLFPPAYADEAELEAEYQRLMGDELVRRRQETLAVVRESIARDQLTEAELHAWVGVFNDVRLVLGTLLDVSEDREILDVDPDSEDIPQRVAYIVLSEIVEEAVRALSTALPPPVRE
jgi:hypothetical protein